jgi:hypothetical protein
MQREFPRPCRVYLPVGLSIIDSFDTYSAAFRRDRILEMSGDHNSFPVACAQAIELSYPMSALVLGP